MTALTTPSLLVLQFDEGLDLGEVNLHVTLASQRMRRDGYRVQVRALEMGSALGICTWNCTHLNLDLGVCQSCMFGVERDARVLFCFFSLDDEHLHFF